MSTVPPFVPDPDASFSQIIVPTSDTVRYNYLLRILAAAGKHVLYVGETGTGIPNIVLLPQVPFTTSAALPASCIVLCSEIEMRAAAPTKCWQVDEVEVITTGLAPTPSESAQAELLP